MVMDPDDRVTIPKDGLAIRGGMASLIAWVLYQFAVVSGAVDPSAASASTIHHPPAELRTMTSQVSEMHRWQSKEDADGVKLIYVPRSWVDAQRDQTDVLRSLKSSIDAQTQAFERSGGP